MTRAKHHQVYTAKAMTFSVWNMDADRPATQEEIENELLINPWTDGSGRFDLDEKEPDRGMVYNSGRKYRIMMA